AELVVPQAFQDSKSYEVAVRNSLSFLVANIGTLGAEPAPAAAAEAAGLTAVTGLPVASGAVADTASAGRPVPVERGGRGDREAIHCGMWRAKRPAILWILR